jgi:CDP-glucose 4,6-dehydratase
MPPFRGFFKDKIVFVTGHTGFKGAWLSFWLHLLGAKVRGFALEPPTTPSLFQLLNLENLVGHTIGDVRDFSLLRSTLEKEPPDIVFHLAAQPLVRQSYETPLETYQVNVMGTVHLLEALRTQRKPCAAVMVTTDKCYENKEWEFGYREVDPLGGVDPYSSSKAAAEIAISSFRRSFFVDHPVKIGSARAGNVIGGGDWALDRIVPDCIRFLQNDQPIPVRNKFATRPWQHVLEPLSGYLWLAVQLFGSSDKINPLAPTALAYNFGPSGDSNRTVEELVTAILKYTPGSWVDQSSPHAPHEAGFLHLSIDKARQKLGWFPAWDFAETIRRTVEWYFPEPRLANCSELRAFSKKQIESYVAKAQSLGVRWAKEDKRGVG